MPKKKIDLSVHHEMYTLTVYKLIIIHKPKFTSIKSDIGNFTKTFA